MSLCRQVANSLWSFEGQCCLPGFWLFEIQGNRIYRQGPIISDQLPDFSLLFFHSPPEISDFCHAGKADLFGGAWWPKTALLKSCLYATAVSIVLTFAFLSCWPSGKQALQFLKHSDAYRAFDFLKSREIVFAGNFRPNAWLFFVVLHSPPEISDFCHAGKINLLAGALWPKTALRVDFCVSLSLASGKQVCNFWSAMLTRVLATFWDPGQPIFMQRCKLKDPLLRINLPDFSLLSFHSPLKSFWLFSAKEISRLFAIPCLACWPSGKQALKFWSSVLPTGLLTIWDGEKSHLHAASLTQRPITSDHMPDFAFLSYDWPWNLSDFCQPRREKFSIKRLYPRAVCLFLSRKHLQASCL